MIKNDPRAAEEQCEEDDPYVRNTHTEPTMFLFTHMYLLLVIIGHINLLLFITMQNWDALFVITLF